MINNIALVKRRKNRVCDLKRCSGNVNTLVTVMQDHGTLHDTQEHATRQEMRFKGIIMTNTLNHREDTTMTLTAQIRTKRLTDGSKVFNVVVNQDNDIDINIPCVNEDSAYDLIDKLNNGEYLIDIIE